MSANPEQEYFADGVVEEILSALSRIRWLFVIARQSSFSYKGRAVDVRQIGRELGVRYVVEGSVRKAGNRVRIIAQLIDAETDAHIWADRYERELHDIFALQDEITERIVSAIEPTVKAIEIKRALAKPTETLTAFGSYLRALPYYYSQTKEGLGLAEALLWRAIALDPDYAEALGTFAGVITSRIANGWHASRKQEIGDACAPASPALAAGPSKGTCLAAAAYAFAVLGRCFEEALPLAERAIEAHPNSTFVRNRAGAVYANSGESDKAIDQVEIALRMNPLDNITSTFAYTVAPAARACSTSGCTICIWRGCAGRAYPNRFAIPQARRRERVMRGKVLAGRNISVARPETDIDLPGIRPSWVYTATYAQAAPCLGHPCKATKA